jgi:hypothetical protein
MDLSVDDAYWICTDIMAVRQSRRPSRRLPRLSVIRLSYLRIRVMSMARTARMM